MEIISLIGAVQTFFFLLLFNSRPKKQRHDYVLMLFLFLLGLVFLDNYLRNTSFYDNWPQYRGITYCLPMLIAPLMYYYVALLTAPHHQLKKTDYLYLLPFFIFLTYFVATYYFLPAEQKLTYYRQASASPWPMIYAAEFFIIASGPFFAILSLARLRKHTCIIGSNFSYTEGINLLWLKGVFVLVIGVNILMLVSNLLSDFIPVFSWQAADNFVHSTNVALVFFLGYKGFKQNIIYTPEEKTMAEPITHHAIAETATPLRPRYEKSGLQIEEAEKHYRNLVNLVEGEQLYLNPRLSIKQVADKLELSVNHLSQVINQQSGRNFFRFINEYRVEKAKELLSDASNQKYKVLAIAFECGFNSKSSFNTIFKEYTGKTPSEFTQNIKH